MVGNVLVFQPGLLNARVSAQNLLEAPSPLGRSPGPKTATTMLPLSVCFSESRQAEHPKLSMKRDFDAGAGELGSWPPSAISGCVRSLFKDIVFLLCKVEITISLNYGDYVVSRI